MPKLDKLFTNDEQLTKYVQEKPEQIETHSEESKAGVDLKYPPGSQSQKCKSIFTFRCEDCDVNIDKLDGFKKHRDTEHNGKFTPII